MALAAEAIEIQTPRAFLPLLRPARYKGAHGGRGSGKSHHFAEAGVEWCALKPGSRGVCIREVQKTLRESAKRLIEDKIRAMGLIRMFRILEDRIVTPGDGVILFQGMQDHTAESIKSLEAFDWAWTEEAQTMSGRSLELLRPTIRKPGSELWFSWNRRLPSDPVDRLFYGSEPPPNSVCVEVNYYDNPFFPAELESERIWDRRNNPERYAHIWEGDYEPAAIGAIWTRPMIEDGRVNPETIAHPLLGARGPKAEITLERIVVAVDPAVSDDPGANEHGITVQALGDDGRGYVVEDASLSGSPTDWSERAVEMFDKWDADAIVIEVNQGGDMVRHTLDTVRSGLPIIAVRASRGKHVRAEPVSARYKLGHISHVGRFDKLEDQMCLITAAGYQGGGSPDRADAMVWGFTELFPSMGTGLVYPIPERDVAAAPFQIPPYWRRSFAMDTDWRRTVAIWCAIDPADDTAYVYAEHSRSGVDMAVHARGIGIRGAWIRGVIAPTAHGRQRDDGEALVSQYLAQGVHLLPLDDQEEAGTAATLDRLSTGRLKVFTTCPEWLREYRSYHRDDTRKIVEDGANLMRATRYWAVGGKAVASVQPVVQGATAQITAADSRAGY